MIDRKRLAERILGTDWLEYMLFRHDSDPEGNSMVWMKLLPPEILDKEFESKIIGGENG